MDYIICDKPGKLSFQRKEMPIRSKGEALLKIQKVGICGTDLHAFSGNQAFFTYPRILGHELAATVEEIDENPLIKPDDRVVVLPYINCGNCIACSNQKSNCCQELKVLGVHLDGGMQQFITVRDDLLLTTPNLSFSQMAIVEPLAIGAHAVDRAMIRKNEDVVVVGCGPIGLGIMKFAALAGARVIALDMNQQRLEFAKSSLGVAHTIDVTAQPLEALMALTNNNLAPVVFDATGNKHALESGLQYMAHGGRYILVGLSKGDLTFHHPLIHAREASVLCSRNATIKDFEYVIDTLEQYLFPSDSYITDEIGYHELIKCFDGWTKPDSNTIKATVDFQK